MGPGIERQHGSDLEQGVAARQPEIRLELAVINPQSEPIHVRSRHHRPPVRLAEVVTVLGGIDPGLQG